MLVNIHSGANVNERVDAGGGFGDGLSDYGSDGRTGALRVNTRALSVGAEALSRGTRIYINERAGAGDDFGADTGEQGSDGRTGTLHVDASAPPVSAEALDDRGTRVNIRS